MRRIRGFAGGLVGWNRDAFKRPKYTMAYDIRGPGFEWCNIARRGKRKFVSS